MKSWEKVCSFTIFHQNPEKHSYRPEKLSKLPFLPSKLKVILKNSYLSQLSTECNR